MKAEEEYESHLYDAVWLLKTLKKVISGVTQQSNVYHSTFHALKDLYKMRQKTDETVEEYFRPSRPQLIWSTSHMIPESLTTVAYLHLSKHKMEVLRHLTSTNVSSQ